MSTFQVINERTRTVLLETDDWILAEERAGVEHWPDSRTPISVEGTHPTHDWYSPGRSEGNPSGSRRCRNCGGCDNGSYGSHAPCGYDFGGLPLVTVLKRELAARVAIMAEGKD